MFKGVQLGPNSPSFVRLLSCPPFCFMKAIDCLCGTVAQPRHVLVLHRVKVMSAIRPLLRQRASGTESDLTTWNAVANFSFCVCTTSSQAARSGTKKRSEMPGARHTCVCLEGGAQQFKERLKRREHRRRSKEGEEEKAVREQTKAAGATAAVCCLFTVSSLPRKSGSALCRRRRNDVHESD